MSLWRWLLTGLALLFIGGLVACAFWSVCALMTVPCHYVWDSAPGCRAVMRNAYLASALPVGGILILVIAPLVAYQRGRAKQKVRT